MIVGGEYSRCEEGGVETDKSRLCRSCFAKRRMPRMNHHDGGRMDREIWKRGWYDHGEGHGHG